MPVQGARIPDGIVALTTDNQVVARTSGDRVIASPTTQHVGAGATGNEVIAGTADKYAQALWKLAGIRLE